MFSSNLADWNIIRHHESCSAFFISSTAIKDPKNATSLSQSGSQDIEMSSPSLPFKEIGKDFKWLFPLFKPCYISLISSLMRLHLIANTDLHGALLAKYCSYSHHRSWLGIRVRYWPKIAHIPTVEVDCKYQ